MQIILLANKVGWGVQSLGRVIQDQLNNEGHSVQTLYFEDLLTHAGCAHLEDLRKLYSSDILLGRENRVNQFIRSINEIDQTALDRLEQILDQNKSAAIISLIYTWSLALNMLPTACLAGRTIIDLRLDAKLDQNPRANLATFNTTKVIFFDDAQNTLNWTLANDRYFALPYPMRERAVFIQGGGWNLLTAKDREWRLKHSSIWEISKSGPSGAFQSQETYAGPFTAPPPPIATTGIRSWPLIKHAKAMYTKPGGMSILEGISFEPPLILTEPISMDEQNNLEFALAAGVAMTPAQLATCRDPHAEFAKINQRMRQLNERARPLRELCDQLH